MGKKIAAVVFAWLVFFVIYYFAIAKDSSFAEIIRGVLFASAAALLIDIKSSKSLVPISKVRNKGLFFFIACAMLFSLWLLSMSLFSGQGITIALIWKPLIITVLFGLLLAFNIWLYPIRKR